jgi:peptidoglycan/xylan/chitin deacetylase (PgdA/CDA1 family)
MNWWTNKVPRNSKYQEWFWNDIVPCDIGDQASLDVRWMFWNEAVPNNWAPRKELELGHEVYKEGDQGYYRYNFWKHAVPENWTPIPNIKGWTLPIGGYYAQWFWLHAVPDNWATNPDFCIGGVCNKGYYNFWFSNFAVIRDFAWDPNLSINGSKGSGYYDYWFHNYFGSRDVAGGHYAKLREIAGDYLKNALVPAPVNEWFDPDANVVVILSFDTEGDFNYSYAVSEVLQRKNVTASFMLLGDTVHKIHRDTKWYDLLKEFDIENHTEHHAGYKGLFMALHDGHQQNEIRGAQDIIQNTFKVNPISFRTPWCDGSKSLDSVVLDNILSQGIKADSSIATISEFNRTNCLEPPLGLRLFSLYDFPYPFIVKEGQNNTKLVEFPFSYPSDWTAGAYHSLSPDLVLSHWKEIFDEIYIKRGVFVLLMHPWLMKPDKLESLISYMLSKKGVFFSNFREATEKYLSSRE